MAAKKSSHVYVCSNCDSQFPGFLGRCPECGKWGTIASQTVSVSPSREPDVAAPALESLEHGAHTSVRWSSGVAGVDDVFGGGLVPGALVLLGGDPGIGKSTLVSQIAARLGKPVLYASGEESRDQVAGRFARLGLGVGQLAFLGEANISDLAAAVTKAKPSLVIVDSVQTFTVPEANGEPGSVSQVKAVTARLAEIARESQASIFLIGHVTKDGAMAGPRTLEHLVDVVATLEGERDAQFRLLRTLKNRFGATNMVSVFEMTPQGLALVPNPSERLLADRHEGPGSAIAALLEGSRVFLVEVQALVQPTVFGLPRRTVSGLDQNRLQVLLAILIKRAQVKLATQDVFVNVVGGLKLTDRGSDLAVAIAIASAVSGRPVKSGWLALGELGLGGEVRGASNAGERAREAARLGYADIIVSAKSSINVAGVRLHPARDIASALKLALE
jgi:DNA repair protein RadA/Sms